MHEKMARDVIPGTIPEPGLRYEWLNDLVQKNGYKIGAEIGCAGGAVIDYLLKHNLELEMTAVDLWAQNTSKFNSGYYDHWGHRNLWVMFNKVVARWRKRLTILRGYSWDMAEHVEDCSLDFVFIDADHNYESVKKDIIAWAPKVKLNGIICGHDTLLKGVKKAIDELVPSWQAAGVNHIWYAMKEEVLL